MSELTMCCGEVPQGDCHDHRRKISSFHTIILWPHMVVEGKINFEGFVFFWRIGVNDRATSWLD
jgi:hypothetical protein